MNDVVKCLLVDDREENLVALTALLAADDVLVLGARSGPEALELLLVHEFALALIDVRMPEMNGLELAELMRGAGFDELSTRLLAGSIVSLHTGTAA